jgi:hypothetical protein
VEIFPQPIPENPQLLSVLDLPKEHKKGVTGDICLVFRPAVHNCSPSIPFGTVLYYMNEKDHSIHELIPFTISYPPLHIPHHNLFSIIEK